MWTCSGEGKITVPGRKLLDICRALPDGTEITLTLEGERMLVRAKKSRFHAVDLARG